MLNENRSSHRQRHSHSTDFTRFLTILLSKGCNYLRSIYVADSSKSTKIHSNYFEIGFPPISSQCGLLPFAPRLDIFLNVHSIDTCPSMSKTIDLPFNRPIRIHSDNVIKTMFSSSDCQSLPQNIIVELLKELTILEVTSLLGRIACEDGKGLLRLFHLSGIPALAIHSARSLGISLSTKVPQGPGSGKIPAPTS